MSTQDHPPHAKQNAAPHTRPDAGLAGVRLGFLYNHDDVHQVAHTAPIISRLLALAPQLQVDVLTCDERNRAAVAKHLDPAVRQPNFVPLNNSAMATFFEKVLGGMAPLQRIGRLSASRDILSHYDALIAPETTSTMLKTRYGLKAKLIFLPHGVGDRSIGVSSAIARFDFVLIPGNKTRDRMIAEGVARAEDSAIVGYPKFDTQSDVEPRKFFDNDRPTVLYNPHFDPGLSSWFKFGEAVLEYFAGQDRFNLIVAPHVMLFRRKFLASAQHRLIRMRREIPERFLNIPHIRVDTGSALSVDMTYTNAADIYLGDVSSQVYEYIQRSRPAIFLNSHDADWQDNPSYEFWKFGPVVDSIAAMAAALDTALPMSDGCAKAQEEAFSRSISVDPERSAADRSAQAIVDYLHREMD